MLRRVWKPLATTAFVVGTPAYIYTRYYRPSKKAEQTFEISVKEVGPDGKAYMVPRSFPLQSKAQIDKRINEFATLETQTTAEGLVWKHATARLASNDPIEDRNAQAIISKAPTASTPGGELLFFAVMDGHAGYHTSHLLSKVLIPAVALELTTLINNRPTKPASALDTLKSYVYTNPSGKPQDVSPENISRAIQRAFSNLDFEIVSAPIRLLLANVSKAELAKGAIPDLSQHPMATASMQPAMSGSCAIMALLDTSERELYVACTGDSRAVAGIWEETENGEGKWRVEVLSEDQTGRNVNEARRIRSEHPPDEADDVIKRGRILGGLEPSRAFGDARYKWPRDIQVALNQAFLVGTGKSMRGTPSTLKTPPYVTAEPVVVHRFLDIPRPGSTTPTKSTLRFLVLATDGLWDELSSEQVVALVGGHIAGLKGKVPKSALPSLVPTVAGSPTVEGKEKNRDKDEGSWAFVDENVSAHLIRNAFGGGDENRLHKILSITAPHSRRWRDDLTVTVVWWEEGKEDIVRAKL
ncbi:protein serine/threonine phosphatase 2C [Artomyces pyxidatus]|uniref:Protein serine/threonine phosphatase 2C n=1 Tax=Artomyces pyxidatus TaxID=48021 RepID=A0ACB8TJJ4_9AGAM|nr:protein serine/threonine phosphatase 2C [Artomyces pyxidatus]